MGERTSLLALPPHNNCLNTKLCPYAITAKKGTPYKSAAKVLILFVISFRIVYILEKYAYKYGFACVFPWKNQGKAVILRSKNIKLTI